MTNRKIESVLTDEEIEDIKTKVNGKLGQLKRSNTIIREDIFKILERNSKTIYKPISDDDICGFLYNYKEKKFTYINTYIPLEKQVFTAAHELYHVWFSNIQDGQPLYSEILDENVCSYEIKKEDFLANRFAAEFLVQEDVFRNEVNQLLKGKLIIKIREIVELMDIFLVPYKTIIKRLYELKFINEKEYENYISSEKMDPTNNVSVWEERLKLCSRNNERTKIVKLNDLVDISVELYEKKLITYEKFEYLLNLSGMKPKDLNINEEIFTPPNEEELLKFMKE